MNLVYIVSYMIVVNQSLSFDINSSGQTHYPVLIGSCASVYRLLPKWSVDWIGGPDKDLHVEIHYWTHKVRHREDISRPVMMIVLSSNSQSVLPSYRLNALLCTLRALFHSHCWTYLHEVQLEPTCSHIDDCKVRDAASVRWWWVQTNWPILSS